MDLPTVKIENSAKPNKHLISFSFHSQIDELFEKKFLSQTKQLANGSHIKIFSRKRRGYSNNFMYSCHLCGLTDLGDEQALHLHVMDKMHRDLFNLKLLPMRSWMQEVVVEEDKNTCQLGDCSQLKSMLDNLCKMNLKPKNSEVEKPKNLKRFLSSEKSQSSMTKRRRLRSPTERRSRSRSRKSSKWVWKRSFSRIFEEFSAFHRRRYRGSSKNRRDESSDSSSHASPRRVRGPQNRNDACDDPPPSFLSICRLLVTLEQFISKYSNDISRLFSLSLSLERESIGSSNSLLTLDNLKLLDQIKNHMKDQIIHGHMPVKMLGIARTFVNDFERLVKENGPVKVKQENMLIDIEMPEF